MKRTSGTTTRRRRRGIPSATDDGLPTHTRIRGARMHNLRGIDCDIPLRQITIITGVSGSGKSTLAFDILYAEGQRRFVECLSAYARQFMERLERPQAEQIGYVQPPVALKQRVSIKNARSTVGSITELSDYLRLLFVHAAEARCLECGGEVRQTDSEQALAAIRGLPPETRVAIVSPLAGEPDQRTLRRLLRDGYGRVLLDGSVMEIEEALTAGAAMKRTSRRGGAAPGGTAGVVIDRLIIGKTRRNRIAEALRAAWSLGHGVCEVHRLERSRRGVSVPLILRQGFTCVDCGRRMAAPTPPLFSWNSPLGACPECQGFGRIITVDRDKVVPDRKKNLKNHAVVPFSVPSSRYWYRWMLREARRREIPTDVPFGKLNRGQQDWVFSGDEGFSGVNGYFEYLERKRYKMHVRIFISRFRGYVPCPRCRGARLQPEALAFTVAGKTIHDLHQLPIGELQEFCRRPRLPAGRQQRVRTLLESIRDRLHCLTDLGVGYLTLGRSGRTLSGGETQRIRIAAALGSSLTDTLFILDEPTVGLHAADTAGMVSVLRRLARTGNTVVVVEHDPQVITAADHLIVLGPGGGRAGGRVLYQGPPAAFLSEEPDFFAAPIDPQRPLAAEARAPTRRRRTRGGQRRAPGRKKRPRLAGVWDADAVQRWQASRAVRAGEDAVSPRAATNGHVLALRDAREHNLRIPSLAIPATSLCVITGVSGSGKSTLLDEVIHRNWLRAHGKPVEEVGRVGSISGLGRIAAAHLVGQDLLGRSSRSNPVSFVKAYADIRQLLAGTLAARQHALQPGAFSFNVSGGRCDACRGMGTQVLEMYFLPDVEAPCEVCGGQRFRPEILGVRWRGKNIAEILAMTVDEASTFFRSEPQIVDRLAPLRDVGLGYILLGQSTATLSTGEAQRLRLGSFLARGETRERHLFLFDEPTTGLHARDVGRLLRALRSLVLRGHGVIAVEHQLDFIRAADWVVDLGPGAGVAGGQVVYAGPVAGLLGHRTSLTARALAEHLARIAAW